MSRDRRSGRVSAGILLYRFGEGGLEVLLGHPGGPYFANKHNGHWSIPKGEAEPGEDLETVARREFWEETGTRLRSRETLLSLGEITQKGGKRVVAWAVEGDLDPAAAKSNHFTIEWPPRSGRRIEVPEIDEVAWLTPDDARRRIKDTQIPFIDRLEAALAMSVEP
jgi:predicted NUDIX family NTP pyrophosphohydrolase